MLQLSECGVTGRIAKSEIHLDKTIKKILPPQFQENRYRK